MAPVNKALATCPVPQAGPDRAPCKNADIIHCSESVQNRVALPRPPASKKHLLFVGWTEPTHSFPSGCPVLLYWPNMDLNSLLTGRRCFVVYLVVCRLIQLTPCSLHSLQLTHGASLAEPKPAGEAQNFIIRSKRKVILSLHMLDKS